MPIYNCAGTLHAAIRSILIQTFWDWELLLIDDGSSDETVDVARSYSSPRVRVVSDGTHRGLPARLNQAIGLSRGKYFARMDGDDVAYPDRLTLQVQYLEGHPEIDLLGGGILVFGSNGRVWGTRENHLTHEHICRRPWSGFALPHPTWIGRTQWFRKHLYGSDAVRCEDQDLLLRAYENSRFATLPEILLGYREAELTLKNILVGRRSFMRSVVREAKSKRRYDIALIAIVEQTLKGFTDAVAVATGLNYRLLRHRALPVDEFAKAQWAKVWTAVHEAAIPVVEGPEETAVLHVCASPRPAMGFKRT
jgi:glycosyltransferase involved in cell wall biosynthesis